MRKSIPALCCISVICMLKVAAPSNLPAAVRLIKQADSIVLVSHLTTEENHDKKEALINPRSIPIDTIKNFLPSFFSGQNINPAIIVQRRKLSAVERQAMIKIIQPPVPQTGIGYSPLCFEPHHAVLIYRQGRFSFIEICFHCNGQVTSGDIELSNTEFFLQGKWERLKAFFVRMGLGYEITSQ